MRARFASCFGAGACTALVLGCPQFESDFVIASDASVNGDVAERTDGGVVADGAMRDASGSSSGGQVSAEASVDSAANISDAGVDVAEAGQDSTASEGGNEAGFDATTGDGGNEAGVCTLNTTQCMGNGVETCSSNGHWGSPVACGGTTRYCANGACVSTVPPPSCQASGAGLSNCGASGESCRATLEVSARAYDRTYTSDADGGPVGEADPATVSSFRLDKYEVTVARFRQFVNAWTGRSGYAPPAGSGKHTHLNGGLGLVNVGEDAGVAYETGWVASDSSNIAPTNVNLACPGSSAWTAAPGSSEGLPIDCVNWWEAYAFCIWDGGFLPSESEWEYAASGGSQQREYPWGATAPGTSSEYAIYGCYYPNGSGTCNGMASLAPVGTAAEGAGLWGQLDLAGNVYEWNLDWSSTYVDPCADCANLTTASGARVIRGGDCTYNATNVLSWFRASYPPSNRSNGVGLRCARTP